MDAADQAEIPLAGGDVTEGVVRVGDTVRRPVGPHSPLVHALLTHLASVGFVALVRTRRAWYLMNQRARTQGGGWQRMWDEGAGDVIKRREAWLDRHAARLTAALTAP